MKRRIYKKWLKTPFNKRLIWKFCKPFDRIPIAVLDKENNRVKTEYTKVLKQLKTL